MISGINTDIEHAGKVYHVQTEDGGVQNPVIVTHLFSGGAILASQRASYAELIASGPNTEAVRELMKKQHQTMVTNLTSNQIAGVGASPSIKAKVDAPSPARPSLPRGRRSLDEVIDEYLQGRRGRTA